MSGKNQYPVTFNWSATDPRTGFLPVSAVYGGGSKPSGTVGGAMASTNVIYSQILDKSRMDNVGLELNWTGTPTGTLQVMCSNSGLNFYALTFNPSLGQPAGSASGELINLNQVPFKYILLIYTNTSGSGTLTAYGQLCDLN